MSAPINDGGPAFPVAMNEISGAYCGMTLRDWFAGQALAGLSARSVDVYRKLERTGTSILEIEQELKDVICDVSYKYADAMLAARERKEEGQ